MSHLHQRAERTCLNCGATLYDRYCHKCGQENVEPKETVGHLTMHVVEDITHFDGKFFSSMKYLFTKPGFLTAEYVAGKRMAYLNPIRMYLFISAIFFFVLMTFFVESDSPPTKKTTSGINDTSAAKPLIKTAPDAVLLKKGSFEITTRTAKKPTHVGYTTSLPYLHVYQYDSAQLAIPSDKRDNSFQRYINRGLLATIEYANAYPDAFQNRIKEKFFHSLPQVLFVSLPLYAFILMMLYFRRKQFYYVSHIIFCVHIYCFTLLTALILVLVSDIPAVGSYISLLLLLFILVYPYFSMRRFYGQGFMKTGLKYLISMSVMSVVVILLVVVDVVKLFLTMAAHPN